MSGTKTFEQTDPGLGPGGQVSSRQHPFQSFQWADYSAKPEHEYTYSVVPLYGSPQALEEGARASVTVETESELGGTHSVFFNRGAVASQEYARRFQDKRPDQLTGENREAAYAWLSRGLLEALLGFIGRAEDDGYGLFGAIYEFELPQLLDAIRAAHLRGAEVRVIYDGIPNERGPRDDNEEAIAEARIKGLCAPRTTGTIMHNKFFVLTRNGRPVSVWTGSTNITENGVFGHLNCGHVVEDESTAAEYLAYWHELRTNPTSATEKQWMAANNPRPPESWSGDLTTVFSPHSGSALLDWYAEIAASADYGLFMSFAFGMDERFKDVYRRDDEVLRFALMEKAGTGSNAAQHRADIEQIRRRRNVIIAIGAYVETNSFDRWLAEIDRVTAAVNVRWVHTKFMLVDPLTRTPIVVTGSANFSGASTYSNNENMLVIRGDTRTADIYLGEFMRQWSHYAFREAVARARATGDTTWRPQYLIPDSSWTADYFDPDDDRFVRRRYFAQAG
jgi:phosphatidylserine/phosphatidylglycerophosphate/cardiolipin synthase-like enzyme